MSRGIGQYLLTCEVEMRKPVEFTEPVEVAGVWSCCGGLWISLGSLRKASLGWMMRGQNIPDQRTLANVKKQKCLIVGNNIGVVDRSLSACTLVCLVYDVCQQLSFRALHILVSVSHSSVAFQYGLYYF